MPETPTAAGQLDEQLWQVIADVRDAHPRAKNDADTWDVVAAVLPVVAAELRRIADEIFDRRDDDNAWWFVDLLRARAVVLDPPAGQED